MKLKKYILLSLFAFILNNSFATVKFDGRSFLIDGVLLLQDADDTLAYYYAPKYPTLALKQDSSAEFLFMKYIGEDQESSGALFHALIEFTISDSELKVILKKLQKKVPKARLKGRLSFLPSNGSNGDYSGPTFQVVSSVLSNTGDGGLTRSILASGNAPMTPGSKAAIAANLDSRGSSLFGASLKSGETSDISIGLKAYYEAILPSYNAVITVDMEKIYSEFLDESNEKKFFSQKDIKKTLDSIANKGGIKIDIADRSQAMDIDNAAMASLLDMISAKITDTMFGAAQGDIKPSDDGMGDAAMGSEMGMGMGGMDPMMMMMMMGGMGGGMGAGANANASNTDDDDDKKKGDQSVDDDDKKKVAQSVGDEDKKKTSQSPAADDKKKVAQSIGDDDKKKVAQSIGDDDKKKTSQSPAADDKKKVTADKTNSDQTRSKSSNAPTPNNAQVDNSKSTVNPNKAVSDKTNLDLADKEAKANKAAYDNSTKGKSDKLNLELAEKEAAKNPKSNPDQTRARSNAVSEKTPNIDPADKKNVASADKKVETGKANPNPDQTRARSNAVSEKTPNIDPADKKSVASADKKVETGKANSKAGSDNKSLASSTSKTAESPKTNSSNNSKKSVENKNQTSMKTNVASNKTKANLANTKTPAKTPPKTGGGGAMMGVMMANMMIDKALKENTSVYTLKNKKEVKLTKYQVNLSKAASIKVPFYTSGNLSLFFQNNKDNENYFKSVNLDDASFQKRDITFQVDNEYADAFGDILNFVTINFRKKYANGQPEFTSSLQFSKEDIASGTNIKYINYKRLGLTGKDWQDYEYQIVWNLKGNSLNIRVPENDTEWIKSSKTVITIAPPFKRQEIAVDAERDRFVSEGYSSANIRFATVIGGKPTHVKRLLLKSSDPEWSSKVCIYHDSKQPVVYETTWYSPKGEVKQEMQQMNANYLFVVPPAQPKD
jgi:hypothetical protein